MVYCFINSIIISSLSYGLIMYMIKNINKNETVISKIENTQNADNLLYNIQSSLINDDFSTTHFYNEDLPAYMQSNIDIIDNQILKILGPSYKSINEINEIYFTATQTNNSDKSFIQLHTDSPMYFCSTYRFLVCLKPNEKVTTIIPGDNYSEKLNKYDILGFDYANTLHYITISEDVEPESRIVLKMHYASNDICHKLTKNYTKWARNLYETNKKTIGFMGNGMLISQFIASYKLYVLLFYYTIGYFYFTTKNTHPLLQYVLLTSCIFSGFHFAFSSMFIL